RAVRPPSSTPPHTQIREMFRSPGLRTETTLRRRPLNRNADRLSTSSRYGPVTICDTVAVVVPAATFSRSRRVAGSIATCHGTGDTTTGVVYPPSPSGTGRPGFWTGTRARRRPARKNGLRGISGQRRRPAPAEEVGYHGREIAGRDGL